MIAVLQRVTEAQVVVDGQIVGRIGGGLLALVAVHATDTDADVEPESRAEQQPETVAATSAASSSPAPDKPAPGARPVRPTSSRTGRPSGKRNTRRR